MPAQRNAGLCLGHGSGCESGSGRMEFTSGHKAAAQDGRLVSENAAVPHVWQLWRCANTTLLTGVARQLLIRCMCVMRRPESPRRELHRVMRTVCSGTHLKLKPDLARVDSKFQNGAAS